MWSTTAPGMDVVVAEGLVMSGEATPLMRKPIIGDDVWYREYEDDELADEGGVRPPPLSASVIGVREDNSVRLVAFVDRPVPVRNIPYWVPYSEQSKGNTWGWMVPPEDSRPTVPYDVVRWVARLALLRAREAETGGDGVRATVLRELAEDVVFQWEEWQPTQLGTLPPLRIRRRNRG